VPRDQEQQALVLVNRTASSITLYHKMIYSFIDIAQRMLSRFQTGVNGRVVSRSKFYPYLHEEKKRRIMGLQTVKTGAPASLLDAIDFDAN
jgi:hypothetical protein